MKNREKTVIALKKAKTSLEKILSIVESDKNPDCFRVIQQALSVTGLLRSANLLMLESHIQHTLESASKESPRKIQALEQEILKVLKASQK